MKFSVAHNALTLKLVVTLFDRHVCVVDHRTVSCCASAAPRISKRRSYMSLANQTNPNRLRDLTPWMKCEIRRVQKAELRDAERINVM